MKRFLFIALVVFNYAFAKAQTNNPPNKVEAPMIGVKLMLGAKADFGETQIKFKKVLADSRCPKDVQCVWAGEAKVLVEIYKNGQLDKEKELTFAALNSVLGIIDTEILGIKALRLLPYPDTSIPKNKKDYYLVLDVRED